MLTVGFETAIPASQQPQTHALDRAATGIGFSNITSEKFVDWLCGCVSLHLSRNSSGPARQHGISGTGSYSSHDPGLAPKPSHGTTSAPTKQQALKTKMNI
jgi:hypothetical protein